MASFRGIILKIFYRCGVRAGRIRFLECGEALADAVAVGLLVSIRGCFWVGDD
jgi:hypothetical protein